MPKSPDASYNPTGVDKENVSKVFDSVESGARGVPNSYDIDPGIPGGSMFPHQHGSDTYDGIPGDGKVAG